MKLIGNMTLNFIGMMILYCVFGSPTFMSQEYLAIVLSMIMFNMAGVILNYD